MNMNLTELVAILDMSGSMHSLANDTIGGYNALIEEQKKADGDAYVTTVLFDDRYIVLHDRVNIQDVKPLTNKEYCPLGMTAMLDAIGKTIISVGQKLAAMDEKDRPGTVMVTIITDGYENASEEFTWKSVQDMIKEQREKYNWLFTFIGANIDTRKVSQDMGIDARFAKSYSANSVGVSAVYQTVSNAMSFSRKASSSSPFGMSESCMEDLADILNEIEEKSFSFSDKE